jgi:voltage-gated potassium channel
MVAKVPLFARLDVATLARLVRMLHARKLAQGAVVFHKDERADAMYFIASGEVEIELGSTKSVRLGEGDFFGEMALLKEDTRRSATVSVSKTAELLVLNAPDFRRLLAQNPDLHAAIGEIASQRQKDTAARLAAARRQAGTHQRAVRSPRSR